MQRVDASKLSNNQRDIEVKFTCGMKIKQAVQKIEKCEKDVIIVHVGTNNLSMRNPEQICKETMEMLGDIQKNNQGSKIVYSSILKRKDNMVPNGKAMQVNKILAEKIPLIGMDILDNSNIMFSNLWQDGLHISDGGVRIFR